MHLVETTSRSERLLGCPCPGLREFHFRGLTCAKLAPETPTDLPGMTHLKGKATQHIFYSSGLSEGQTVSDVARSADVQTG